MKPTWDVVKKSGSAGREWSRLTPDWVTNGWVAVMVATDEEMETHEPGSWKTIEKLLDADRTESAEVPSLRIAAETPKRETCSGCSGSGTHSCECGEGDEHDCGDCDGVGSYDVDGAPGQICMTSDAGTRRLQGRFAPLFDAAHKSYAIHGGDTFLLESDGVVWGIVVAMKGDPVQPPVASQP
jgi:hypothetical protein